LLSIRALELDHQTVLTGGPHGIDDGRTVVVETHCPQRALPSRCLAIELDPHHGVLADPPAILWRNLDDDLHRGPIAFLALRLDLNSHRHRRL
jgi:hypothetical protein